jgi:hypothetical protein
VEIEGKPKMAREKLAKKWSGARNTNDTTNQPSPRWSG